MQGGAVKAVLPRVTDLNLHTDHRIKTQVMLPGCRLYRRVPVRQGGERLQLTVDQRPYRGRENGLPTAEQEPWGKSQQEE